MYQNFNIWNRLRTCVVGRSWPPEFYSWIADKNVRSVMEKIAVETEEDYQQLIQCLNSLGVTTLRPDAVFDLSAHNSLEKLPKPPMCPRDNMIMLGNVFLETASQIGVGNEPVLFQDNAPTQTHNESSGLYQDIFAHVRAQGNTIESHCEGSLCAAMIYQIDNRIFFSTFPKTNKDHVRSVLNRIRPEVTTIPFHQFGHIDGWFAPVCPNLMISSQDSVRSNLLDLFYKTFFPNTEIVYANPSFGSDYSFIQWQKINNGRWWIPGEENNRELTTFINRYFDHWLGQVDETAFEVNMIIVDSKNVIVSNYNENIFKKFKEHYITPHLCNFRHEKFWDAGLSCITCELDRTI